MCVCVCVCVCVCLCVCVCVCVCPLQASPLHQDLHPCNSLPVLHAESGCCEEQEEIHMDEVPGAMETPAEDTHTHTHTHTHKDTHNHEHTQTGKSLVQK